MLARFGQLRGRDARVACAAPGRLGVIALYALAYASTCLVLIAPLLVTLALKINSLFGTLSDRTSSRLGMRRPWMLIGPAGGSLGILRVAKDAGVFNTAGALPFAIAPAVRNAR